MAEPARTERWPRVLGAVLAGSALVAVAAVSWAGTSAPEPSDLPEVAAEQAEAAVEQAGPPEDAGRPEDAGKPDKAEKTTGRPEWAGPKPGKGRDVEPVACEDARNHGQYVSSIARSTPPGPDKGAIVSAAAESDCPPGFRDRPDD
jgi:hypothetical protein